MIKVSQTILAGGEGAGNCLQAAVATILCLPLDRVPHFAEFTWWDAALELWLRGKGLTGHHTYDGMIPAERCLVFGKSPRGYGHAVVGEGGVVVWDPHPSRDGLTVIEECIVFEDWPTGPSSGCMACGQDMAAAPGPFLHQHICPGAS